MRKVFPITADCSFITVHSSQFTHHSSLITVHSSQLTHHSSLITVHSSQFTRHSSLVTVHSSQFTHHSLLITVDSFAITIVSKFLLSLSSLLIFRKLPNVRYINTIYNVRPCDRKVKFVGKLLICQCKL